MYKILFPICLISMAVNATIIDSAQTVITFNASADKGNVKIAGEKKATLKNAVTGNFLIKNNSIEIEKIVVLMKDWDTGFSLRDKNLVRTIKLEFFSEATVRGCTLLRSSGEYFKGSCLLDWLNSKNPVVVDAKKLDEKSFEADFYFLLTHFKVELPRFMMKQVDDSVEIHLKVVGQ